jgi:glycerol uptake facilitator-like aquaporin
MVGGKQSPLSQRPEAVPYTVGLYITAAYWFAASTSFANPAVTIARSLSDTFAGIAPGGVAAFVVAQLAGMLVAVGLSRWLWRKPNDRFGQKRRDGRNDDAAPCPQLPRKRTFGRCPRLVYRYTP